MDKPRLIIHRPPVEIPAPTTTYAKIFSLVAGIGLFVAAVNFISGRLVERYSTETVIMHLRTVWNLAATNDKPVDWLVLGDCGGSMSVDPAILEKNFGGKAINLSTQKDYLASDDAWLLNIVIRRSGPPKHVLIVNHYQTYMEDFDPKMLWRLPIPLSEWKHLTPPPPMRFKDKIMWAIMQFIPTYPERVCLNQVIRHPLTYEPLHFDMMKNGYLAIYRSDEVFDFEAETKKMVTDMKDKPFVITGENLKALDHIAGLADKYKFDVFIVEPPTYPPLLKFPDYAAFTKRVETGLTDYASKHAHVFYLSVQSPVLATGFTNLSHFYYATGQQFSHDLVQSLIKFNRSPKHHEF